MTAVNERRLTLSALIVSVLVGVITAGLAVTVTLVVVGQSPQTYRAQARVALVPSSQLTASDVQSYWTALQGGQAGRIAAEVLRQPQWVDAAAKTAGVTPSSIAVTAGVVGTTSMINVTAQTTSAAGAEAALSAVITAATPSVQQVSGSYVLSIVQPAAGTAVASGVPRGQLLGAAGLFGFVLGMGTVLTVAWTRARRGQEPEYFDTGEFRQVVPSPPPYRQPQPAQSPRGGRYGPPR